VSADDDRMAAAHAPLAGRFSCTRSWTSGARRNGVPTVSRGKRRRRRACRECVRA
jgi:hypothetical protein